MNKARLWLILLSLAGGSFSVAMSQEQPTAPPQPSYPVKLPDGRTIEVKAPIAESHPDGGWMDWHLDKQVSSPDGRFTALKFLQSSNNPKHDPAVIHLVRPDGSVIVLKNSDVFDMVWTKDSKYLLAAVRLLRLWNVNGGLRTKQIDGISDGIDATKNVVCVVDKFFYGDGTGKVKVTRYAVPTLKTLGSFDLPPMPEEGKAFCK